MDGGCRMDRGCSGIEVVQNKVSWPLGIQTLTLSPSSSDLTGHAEVGHGKPCSCLGPVRGQKVHVLP